MRFFSDRVPPLMATLAVVVATLAAVAPARAGDVTFRFRAPEGARLVTVAGTFNGWNSTVAPMSDPDGDGVFETTIHVAEGTQQYKFVVNGTDWYHDENAADFLGDGFGGQNSVMEVGVDAMTVGDAPGSGEEKAGTLVTFRFAPEGGVNSVSVVGSFNGWDAAKHVLDNANGVWAVSLKLSPGEYWYQFVVDGERWLSDPVATEFEKDGFGGRKARLTVGSEPVQVGPRETRTPQ